MQAGKETFRLIDHLGSPPRGFFTESVSPVIALLASENFQTRKSDLKMSGYKDHPGLKGLNFIGNRENTGRTPQDTHLERRATFD
jgi:hypothetical protein